MTTALQLTKVFNDNFVAYFRSHVAHVNIVGRNFHGDHALLGEIYEDLQAQIDTLGELLRSIDEFMPDDIYGVVDTSEIPTDAINGKSDVLLSRVYDDILSLKACYEELMTVADEEEHKEIANYAQERILALAKFAWMLKSTLED